MMAEGRQFSFRLSPDDEDDARVIAWLERQSKRRTLSKVIRRALHEAMEGRPDTVALARAILALAEKLEAAGVSREDIAEAAQLAPDFMAHMADLAKPGQSLE